MLRHERTYRIRAPASFRSTFADHFVFPPYAPGADGERERDGAAITESRFRGLRIVKSMRVLSLTFFKGRIEDAINNCPSLIALVPIPSINLRTSYGNLQWLLALRVRDGMLSRGKWNTSGISWGGILLLKLIVSFPPRANYFDVRRGDFCFVK